MKAHILGFPRIGRMREMKKTVEAYWAKKIDQANLIEEGQKIRQYMWKMQYDNGLDFVQVGDFVWYDHILNHSALLGVIPARFKISKLKKPSLDDIFRMARGRAPKGEDTTACEMTKWFDTNYHYIVPEFQNNQDFCICYDEIFGQLREAQALGYKSKLILPGPATYLYLGKEQSNFHRADLLNKLLEVYKEIFDEVIKTGCTWVQIDEPILSIDLNPKWKNAVRDSIKTLSEYSEKLSLKLLFTTYFEEMKENLYLFKDINVNGLHIDASSRGISELNQINEILPPKTILSVGIVDGRKIWKNDLTHSLNTLKEIHKKRKDNLWIGSSCSLLHVPVDLDSEEILNPPELKNWLAFAVQKIQEISTLKKELTSPGSCEKTLKENKKAINERKTSSLIHKKNVKERVESIDQAMFKRKNSYDIRAQKQREKYNLPLFPTTTIGSFPQTNEIRKSRRDFKKGDMSEQEYTTQMKKEINMIVQKQEEYDIDVLVHGEPERNDMVEFFAEFLNGYAFTNYGWVQSYGSRCVKPPIIFGDVSRKEPMTIKWSKYAQSLTKRKMKGMLTGPVTMVFWTFYRDDISIDTIAYQIGLAIRDEVEDLEKSGINMIQIDEPAFREGLPIRENKREDYLKWAVNSFRLSSSGIKDETQIHTHMCYSEFNDIIRPIADLDADVITIETSRSNMELLNAFEGFNYPNEIGPGVYDIHSPRIPEIDWMIDLMRKATEKIPMKQLWINPDCGLKTRKWEETELSLKNMVTVAKKLRTEFAK